MRVLALGLACGVVIARQRSTILRLVHLVDALRTELGEEQQLRQYWESLPRYIQYHSH